MKKGLSEIVCVIDQSGSMGSIRNDAIGGFNAFLEDQKKVPGEAIFSLLLFDTERHWVHEGISISDVAPLSSETYVPGGMTALNDAVGLTIDSVGSRLAAQPEPERPEHVIIAILTDGQENSSQEYETHQIKERIHHQREQYNWQFLFLAANQDAFRSSRQLGIPQGAAGQFVASPEGTRVAYENLSRGVTALRSGSKVGANRGEIFTARSRQ